jgi:uncharacterized protein (TIGR02452 family)
MTDLTALAEENERIVASGYYEHPVAGRVPLADAVVRAAERTRGYAPAELTALLAEPPVLADRAGRTEVTAESSLAAARRLSGAGGTVGVLNFASARNPGGGYRNGARAQEEDLCRCSALYTCLLRVPEYYAAHRADGDPAYSDRVICSPDVPVFRDENLALLAMPYPVTFLTSAAPNAGVLAQRTPGRLAELPALLTRRAAGVLAVAALHRVDTLVLGAWGCGVFRNSPAEVAAAFDSHLGPGGAFTARFDRVVFAVLDRTTQQRTLAAFQRQFGARAESPN